MNTNIATDLSQSQRLLRCGVSDDTADMARYVDDSVPMMPWDWTTGSYGGTFPAWSLSALLGLLPFKIHSGKYEYWLDIAPMDYGRQWSIGYYCMDKPRVIEGLTHTDSLIECAVQEIEWLSKNGYKLNEQ
jgi:hypothetical protein